MIRALCKGFGWRSSAFITTLWLAIALRAFAVAAPAEAPAGYAPICSGGQILYIHIETGEIADPADLETAPASQICPWFGFGHDSPAIEQFAFALPVAAPAETASTEISLTVPDAQAAFQARAPPTHI